MQQVMIDTYISEKLQQFFKKLTYKRKWMRCKPTETIKIHQDWYEVCFVSYNSSACCKKGVFVKIILCLAIIYSNMNKLSVSKQSRQFINPTYRIKVVRSSFWTPVTEFYETQIKTFYKKLQTLASYLVSPLKETTKRERERESKKWRKLLKELKRFHKADKKCIYIFICKAIKSYLRDLSCRW
jgi:hypothetical protein